MPIIQQESEHFCSTRFFIGALGCLGGLFIHLIVGSVYQWGIINIYITSYYRLSDPTITLEGNSIAFPLMMICIGLTMKFGLFVSQKTHPLLLMFSVAFVQSGIIFASSFLPNMLSFIILYGVLFGLATGCSFMVSIGQCNKYFPGRRMYVNGFILIGTGLGSLIFGLFSYNFLNPLRIPPVNGYYIGNEQLENIARKVPQCIRWLSLLYALIGNLGVCMMIPVCLKNKQSDELVKKNESQNANSQKNQVKEQSNNKKKQALEIDLGLDQRTKVIFLQQSITKIKQQENQESKDKDRELTLGLVKYPTTMKQAFKTKVCWIKTAIIILSSFGIFMLNGNYKTYVKKEINNDEFLTIIGVIGAVGNGCSRFFWNVLFNHTGYRFALSMSLLLQIVIFSTIRFSIELPGVYLFLIFLANCCIGAGFVIAPTFSQIIYGEKVGSQIYGYFWAVFGIANLIQYAFVSGLSQKLTFNGIIYVGLGMSVIALLLANLADLTTPWSGPQQQLGYCIHWRKKSQPKESKEEEQRNNQKK